MVNVQGTHVSWVIVGAHEFVSWYVWAAYTPLVIALAKRQDVTRVFWLRGTRSMWFRRKLGQLHHHADLADVSARPKVQEGRI